MSDWIDITDPSFWAAKVTTADGDPCQQSYSAPVAGTSYTWDGTKWIPPTLATNTVPLLEYIGESADTCTGIRVTFKTVSSVTIGGPGWNISDFIVAFQYDEFTINHPEYMFVVQHCQTNEEGIYPINTVVIVEATSDGVCGDSVPYVPDFEKALAGITATFMQTDFDNCGPFVVIDGGHVSAHAILKIEAMFGVNPVFWTGLDGTEER